VLYLPDRVVAAGLASTRGESEIKQGGVRILPLPRSQLALEAGDVIG
jgi:hypothetical protein